MLRALAVAAALSSSVALAAEAAVPTEVRSVISGGYWEHNGREGIYRVVVTSEGWEHVWSRIFVEWIAKPPSRDGNFTILSTVEPELPFAQGTMILDAKLRPISVNRIEVTVTASSNMVAKAAKSKVLLVATAPGVVSTATTERKP